MTLYLLPPEHPYIMLLRPAVWRLPGTDRWTVRWRSFESVKQDVVFPNEKEARRFARQIMLGPHTWDDENGYGTPYAELDAYWRELYQATRAR